MRYKLGRCDTILNQDTGAETKVTEKAEEERAKAKKIEGEPRRIQRGRRKKK